jgi:uncharacterized Zn finger protein (UPF0148 family)
MIYDDVVIRLAFDIECIRCGARLFKSDLLDGEACPFCKLVL